MTEDERKQAIKKVLPDTVDEMTRPTDSVPTDFPLSTDFPQLFKHDPVSADVFNLINRQMLSNDKQLQNNLTAHNSDTAAHTDIRNNIQTLADSKADMTYVDQKVADLVNGAPEQLDTLQELSKALNNDKDFAVTVTNALAKKLDTTANAVSASKLATPRIISLSGKAAGSVTFDGSDNATLNVTSVTADTSTGNAETATKLATARTISLTGKATGSASFDGSANASINVTAVTADSCTGNSATASAVAWTGITGKPSTYTPASHNHGLGVDNFAVTVNSTTDSWDTIGGNSNFLLKSIRTESNSPNWLCNGYSAGIAFGGGDTKGVMSVAYSSPLVKIAGGNGTKPVWWIGLTGTSGNTYNLGDFPTKTGTGASGTWGISISGNATTATKATYDANGVTLVGIYDNASAHNAIYRGKDLTSYFESGEMSKAIADGTFTDIYIGDYINKNITVDGTTFTVKWEVAHLDYFWHGDSVDTSAHHVLLIPSKTIQTNVPMNDTNTTEGGFLGTKMWTETIPKYVTAISNAFGSDHVLSHTESLTYRVNAEAASGAGAGWVGSSTAWAWTTTLVNIPSEPMVYGGRVFGSSAYDVGNKERQLQLFRMKKFSEGRLWFWLQAVASASTFCNASNFGDADSTGASYSNQWGGIRPYFLLR